MAPNNALPVPMLGQVYHKMLFFLWFLSIFQQKLSFYLGFCTFSYMMRKMREDGLKMAPKIAKDGSKTGPSGPRWPPRSPTTAPRRVLAGQGGPQARPRRLQDGTRRPKVTPKIALDGSTTGPGAPRRGQAAQDGPQDRPRSPKTPPRWVEAAQDGPQGGLKMASRWVSSRGAASIVYSRRGSRRLSSEGRLQNDRGQCGVHCRII